MPIKLIALDIDGTLLDDRKQLPPENREVLLEAERRGFLMAIASGRMISRIEAVESLLGVDCIIMAYNGGKIWGRRSEGRPLIVHQTLSAEVGEYLVHYCREHGYPLNFYHQDRLFAEPRPERAELRELYARRTGAEYEYVDDLLQSFPGVDPTKLIVLAYPKEADALLAFFRETLDGRIFITKSEPEYLEIMAPGVNKGTALPLLAGHYGLSVAQVLAVGDAYNDLDMLLAAGIGVAMANAPEQVKAAARYVTERTNNDGGAAEAIRRWAFNDTATASESCE
jgi:Cof subfamily protein (haloacid dehalogenase superfamily)